MCGKNQVSQPPALCTYPGTQGTSWPQSAPKPPRVDGRTLRARAVLWSELGAAGQGREKSGIPPPQAAARGRVPPLTPPGSRAERAGLGQMGGVCPGHYPRLPPGGPGRLGVGTTAHLAAGREPGPRAPLEREPRAAGQAAGAGGGPGGVALPAGKFLGRERGNCVQLFLVFGRPRAAGTPSAAAPGGGRRPGGRRREGCGRGGASPRGGVAGQAGGAGPGPVASPGPDRLPTKAVAVGRPGEPQGADRSGDWAARVGRGGAVRWRPAPGSDF